MPRWGVLCVSLDVTGANRQTLGRPWFDPGWPDIRKHKVDPDNSGSGGQQREEHRYSDVSEQTPDCRQEGVAAIWRGEEVLMSVAGVRHHGW